MNEKPKPSARETLPKNTVTYIDSFIDSFRSNYRDSWRNKEDVDNSLSQIIEVMSNSEVISFLKVKAYEVLTDLQTDTEFNDALTYNIEILNDPNKKNSVGQLNNVYEKFRTYFKYKYGIQANNTTLRDLIPDTSIIRDAIRRLFQEMIQKLTDEYIEKRVEERFQSNQLTDFFTDRIESVFDNFNVVLKEEKHKLLDQEEKFKKNSRK